MNEPSVGTKVAVIVNKELFVDDKGFMVIGEIVEVVPNYNGCSRTGYWIRIPMTISQGGRTSRVDVLGYRKDFEIYS